MSLGYWETLASQIVDGPTLAVNNVQASAINAGARYTMAPNRLKVGDILRIRAFGRLSTAVTTPGNSNWTLTAGVNNATAIFDTLPLLGNIVVQTTVPWWLEAEGIVRTIGPATACTIFWGGLVASTAFLNVAAVGTGLYAGVVPVPFNTAPVVGSGWDS